MANGIDPGSGSGKQPVLWSSPLMRIPEAAIPLAAEILNYFDGSVCKKYKNWDHPRMAMRIRQAYACQRLSDVKV